MRAVEESLGSRFGCVDTGEVEQGEVVMRLALD
jgi:hypothetical protein